MTELTAIEGIHFSRGKLMEKSANFDRDKFIDWLVIQLPILQSANAVQTKTVERANKCTFETVRDQSVGNTSSQNLVDSVLKTA